MTMLQLRGPIGSCVLPWWLFIAGDTLCQHPMGMGHMTVLQSCGLMAFRVLQWCHPMLASTRRRTSCCTRIITLYGTRKWIQARTHRIKRDCKYTVSRVSGNRAISLGGYLWAVSSIKQEQLQVRCLEETHMIEIQPPLQIVYLGNGCEGYSPSMFLPAKNEMTTHAQIESRREYFLQFNYVYTPDRYIGLWWQFRMRMMSEKEARAFITQVAPLGTMDYSLLHKRPAMIKTNYGFSWPVPPTTLVIGVVVVILLVAGIALGCYVYRMGKTFKLVTGTVKQVTKKPLSCCRLLFSRMRKRTRPIASPHTTRQHRTIEDVPEAHAAEIHPVQMTKILRDVFQDPQLVHKYAKHLDKKVQVDSSVLQEPEIVPDPESATDTQY